ncbi:MAG: RNA polymerase sigma-70 factor [Fermentimonas sp.]|jgi:RNA polymerase sigma-70 factor (ECF subfamily)|nr:RNA polymerase sigma-70 factor [Fermentimonas sp.]MDD4010032.1 RNA polymerase sigma-70 factor [Fermentimonas sp.]
MTKFIYDNKLLNSLKRGDEKAFELIFHQSKGKMMGFLKNVLPRDEDEESILQEIYLKLWLNRKTIDTNQNFETFLFSIARNMVIDVMRKRFNKQKYLDELHSQLKDLNEDGNCTYAHVEYSELENRIYNLIEQLPEQRKKIFKLSRMEGLTYKKIADKLEISENTVDSQIRNALSFLRKEMNYFLSLLFFINF